MNTLLFLRSRIVICLLLSGITSLLFLSSPANASSGDPTLDETNKFIAKIFRNTGPVNLDEKTYEYEWEYSSNSCQTKLVRIKTYEKKGDTFTDGMQVTLDWTKLFKVGYENCEQPSYQYFCIVGKVRITQAIRNDTTGEYLDPPSKFAGHIHNTDADRMHIAKTSQSDRIINAMNHLIKVCQGGEQDPF